MAALRIVFCGTPEFAVPSLRRLAERPEFSVEAVITQPDRPRGRGQHVSSSPVKEAALEIGLHVYQPETIKSESAQEFLKRVAPDAVVIIAYGQIIPARLLTIPRLGWLNLHASLLPRYRGAAPIHWAIANGETITGLTTMQIDAGMDTGPTLLRREVEIGPDETAPELAARMSAIGADLIAESLLRFDRGEISPVPQDEKNVSYAPILKKEDGRIDWDRPAHTNLQPHARLHALARRVHHVSRANVPPLGPPGNTQHGVEPISQPAKLSIPRRIFMSPAEKGLRLRLEAVQIEGRKKISARQFANGARLDADDGFD